MPLRYTPLHFGFVLLAFALPLAASAGSDLKAKPRKPECFLGVFPYFDSNRVAGIGGFVGSLGAADSPELKGAKREYGFVISNTGLKNPLVPTFEAPHCIQKSSQYGITHFRLELGTGLGIVGRFTDGHSLVALTTKSENWISPYLGYEVSNLRFSANTLDGRRDYIEWAPLVGSAGLHFKLFDSDASWSALLIGRAGASLGTLGNGGFRLVYGGMLQVNSPTIGISVSEQRILTRESLAVDMPEITAAYRFSEQKMNLGVSAEGLYYSYGGEPERRLMIVFGKDF